ncbi:MAG: hypothetical protein EXR93_08185 [Gemmatimonadetes bacterium]|nr:hypothetical protein [Gemmatimonadota bacterium]
MKSGSRPQIAQIVAAAMIAFGNALPAQAPSWGSLSTGKNQVGVTSWIIRDSTRLTEGRPRAIQVTAWYPAMRGTGNRVQYSDYVALTAAERGDEAADGTAAIQRFMEFLASNGVPSADIGRWLGSPMMAVRDAVRAAGRPPLILIAQGNFHAAYNHAVLGEYLASRGYAVITTPSPGRIGPFMQTDADILPAARAQSQDLALAATDVVKRGWANGEQTAVVAHSFGARAGLLLLADRRISLLVSLDGGIANAQGRGWLDSSALNRRAVHGGIVHVFQDVDSTVVPDFTLMRELTGTDRLLIRAVNLQHWQFTSFGTIAASFPTLVPGTPLPGTSRIAANVVDLTACVLDLWRQGRAKPEGRCLGAEGLEFVERIPAAN